MDPKTELFLDTKNLKNPTRLYIESQLPGSKSQICESYFWFHRSGVKMIMNKPNLIL